jgi:hypothetical protein
MPQVSDVAVPSPRKRGRPPRAIETGALIEAIERLFAHGGIDAVTIERDTVGNAIRSGDLSPGDTLLTTRLILGMTIWVANWFRTR